MSNNELKHAVAAVRDCPQGVPLMSPYTKGRKPGKGRAAEKTLTQAVKEAEAAARHADAVCARAVQLCGCCTLVSLLPWSVRAVVQVARWFFSML